MKTLILCGGSGTRLWPLSRTTCPKQFAPIINHKSLFEMTLERNIKISNEFIVVVNEVQLEHCLKSLSSAYKSQLIIEPAARNTAPAVALACMGLDPNDIVFVVPSDHLITADEKYYECIQKAQELAQENNLVTFGIKARFPETGYGYIEAQGFEVKSFKEKPDLETAKEYIANGNYYWNSGMFCFKAGVFLEELNAYCPDVFNAIKKVHNSRCADENKKFFNKDLMLEVENISIDYAVMEKSKKVKVVPAAFNWSDMGSFDSLFEELEKDADGNSKEQNLITHNSKNNLIIGGKRVIATFDVEDLIIVDTNDALLVGKRGQAQDVKQVVEQLKKSNPDILN